MTEQLHIIENPEKITLEKIFKMAVGMTVEKTGFSEEVVVEMLEEGLSELGIAFAVGATEFRLKEEARG